MKRKGRGGKARKRVLLYGNSVILGTIAASLSRSSEYDVVTVRLPHDKSRVAAFRPDILFFDSDTTRSEEVVIFLQVNPAMLLIGLSPEANQVKVWSIRELREASIKDLIRLIKRDAGDRQSTRGDRSCAAGE